MKTIRLLLATGLALTTLVGVALALTWWQPVTASAEDTVSAPAAPQTLPLPWLSDPNVADAPYHWRSPTVDGRIDPGEYAGAGKVTFPGYGGDVEVFFKQDTITLYVAFELPDKVNKNPWPDVSISLDTNHDGGSNPQPDDFRFLVWRNGPPAEWQGNGSTWVPSSSITWTYGLTETMSGWSVEFGIPFTKLGITAGTFKDMGLALSNGGPGPTYFWPAGTTSGDPSTWGSLVSSSGSTTVPSGWDTFYWKPGPWEDYAPSGMPDFDENQQSWWAYDGPAAVANSFWWFDSKFEPDPYHPLAVITDHYRLVQSYDPTLWDDHHYSNTVPLIDDLARNYFGTNQGVSGTNPISMFFGIHDYLRDQGLWDDYIVTMVISPSFEWVADEVQRSEDVILLLGFYEWIEVDQRWARVGGHYVNVAGVDPTVRQIAFSDPMVDYAEMAGGAGRVLSGTLIPHQPIPGHTPDVHNDAGNVSHDVYTFTLTNSPGGDWGPGGYVWGPGVGGGFWGWIETFGMIFGANPNPFIDTEPYSWTESIQVEVEFALTVSPYTWKSSGYWNDVDDVDKAWQPWEDYAPNGVPDFDEKQDNWGYIGPGGWQWSFCGPAAAANSLWWFDSKFEPKPLGPPLPPYQPPIPYNDNYPLVQTYAGGDPPWDDHDPLNVDDPATLWPPGGEFVEDLAWYFDTDGRRTGIVHAGTIITDLYQGIISYTIDHGLRQGYVITQVKSPDFWWVAEEVEVSEDVILLLGFWQHQDPGWVRLGGHYVTLPGVDKQGGFVAFSDPYYDGAEFAWPYAYPGGWPTVMGRVADGWLQPHQHPPGPPDTTHNDAGNVSHDVYSVSPTDSPGGVWGPWGYVEGGWPSVEPFWGQNGQEDTPMVTADPIQAEVDWAVAVSPVADVFVKKAVKPSIVVPGEWVTFTIAFGNMGNDAENVVISDVLPSGLTNASYTYTLNYTGTLVGHDTYTWTVGTLRYLEGGLITVTAQVDPSLSWPAQTIVTNTVEISTTTQEQYQVVQEPNSDSDTFTVQTADVEIAKSVAPPELHAGAWLTYTLVFTNNGPAAASNTVITDLLHSWLVTSTSSYNVWTSYIGAMPAPTGYYVWPMGDVPAGGWGIITITAQVDPSLSGGGTLPNTASIATITPEWDYTNNSASASNTVVYYGVDLQPDTGGITENPGKTVTYTLTLYNTGNYTDEYQIAGAVVGEPWTTYWPGSTGLVAGGGSTQFTVTVQISPTATTGDWSRVTITATSKSDASKWDTSVLTTTAYTGTITRGVEVAPHAAAQAGHAGTTVTHTLRITNTGTVPDIIGLSHTNPGTWTVTYSANPLSLLAGEGQDVEVYVGIPPGIPGGATRVITVTATSQSDPAESDYAVLTTSVFWRFLYLPIVMRNYP